MVNIFNAPQLKSTLIKLKAEAKPLWGQMSPQHVIEHLSTVVKVSSGKITVKHYLTKEEGDALKAKLIYGDAELNPGIKNPLLGDAPPSLRLKNLEEAFSELYSEISEFEKNCKEDPNKLVMHPRMGELKRSEWHVFHNKHFKHHFKQYDLF
jgi:hydroxymethylglutaryl-CoA reductase